MLGKTLAHHQVLEKLGEGGMGIVYKARDTHLDRFVALKVLPPDKLADAERKQSFILEAKSASALNHPNIVHNPGREFNPSFSPDGNQVAFRWDGGDGKFHIYIKYIKLIGPGRPLRLTNDLKPDYGPAWSPATVNSSLFTARS
jgi:WD40-like Beta Propeller Repeat/Protein kinase domain